MRCLIFLYALSLSCLASKHSRLNVVFFLVDDLGWRDLSCQGSTYYDTPNIDLLAKSGVRFTNAYATCAVCSPTRSSCLTGKYPARTLITQWLPAGRWSPLKHKKREGRFLRSLPLEEITLAETLKKVGYKNGFIGKWHLGGAPFSLPIHHGFHINVGGDDHGAPGSYFYPFKGKWRLPTTKHDIHKQAYQGGEKGDYLTDLLTSEAESFVDENYNHPFFLYFSFYNVHTPLQAKAEKIAKYQSRPAGDRQNNPIYAAMLESVDESVGRIISRLKKHKIHRNTLIIFASDNGGFSKATSNFPLRANKGSFYEGGIRTPMIISLPQSKSAGQTCEILTNSNDFYPTILSALGLPLLPHQHQDGLSLLPWLKDVDTPAPERSLYWHYPHYNRHPSSFPCGVIRQGPWKLIENYDDDSIELYHLENDLNESQNLAQSEPKKAHDLLKKLQIWKRETRAEPMQSNPLHSSR